MIPWGGGGALTLTEVRGYAHAKTASVPFWPISVTERVFKQCATKGRVLNTKCVPERVWTMVFQVAVSQPDTGT